jgi:hypothetical protein
MALQREKMSLVFDFADLEPENMPNSEIISVHRHDERVFFFLQV